MSQKPGEFAQICADRSGAPARPLRPGPCHRAGPPRRGPMVSPPASLLRGEMAGCQRAPAPREGLRPLLPWLFSLTSSRFCWIEREAGRQAGGTAGAMSLLTDEPAGPLGVPVQQQTHAGWKLVFGELCSSLHLLH